METGEDYKVNHKLSLNSMVSGGALQVHWSYSSHHYDELTVQQLAARYIKHLEELITHCVNKEAPVYTPSDYGLSGKITPEQLNEFFSEEESDLDNIMTF